MAGLIVMDVIHVVTQLGRCDIELCFGDIAQLPVEDKVDVVVVSAFRGNYRPTPTSLIGALKRELGMSVFELAANKAEDLREVHHCWWSQRLPDHLPFKRLMCFEAKHAGFSRPQELVGDVFRCLVPILNNQDGSVITPLLNTGDQGHSKTKMMIGMVEAAVNWMKAGLPLRKLKIVLYEVNADREALKKKNEKLCKLFEELKEKYGMKELIQKNVAIEYDVYLSSSIEDECLAMLIQEKLKLAKPDIQIFGHQQELNKEEVWQEDMYEVMIRCARVITVLTPHYLRSVSCMEQYNMALCCNRTSERDMLAPFYVESVEEMPTYMGLVQYVDCLEKDTDKISSACLQLSSMLDVKVHAEVEYEQPKLEYDIFISYCHRNADRAAEVMERVKALNTDLKVFFDTEELKTGATWQQMLYRAIDGTKCFVAMVTKEYLKSPVCQEEFNLSLSKHCQQNDQLIMIPILVDDDLDDLPLEFKQIQLVKATGEYFIPAIDSTFMAILQHLEGKKTKMQSLFTKPARSPNIQNTQEELRRSKLNDKYDLNHGWEGKKFPPDFESFYMKEEKHAKNELSNNECKMENIEEKGDDKGTELSKATDGFNVCQKENTEQDGNDISKELPETIHDSKECKKENTEQNDNEKTTELPEAIHDSTECKKENVENTVDDTSTQLPKTKVGSKESEMQNIDQKTEEKNTELSNTGDDLKEKIGVTNEEGTKLLKDVQKEENKISNDTENREVDKTQVKYDVAVSCTKHDFKYASYFVQMLKQFAPNLEIKFSECSDQEKRVILDNASKIVAFVSSSYLESPSHMEELNIALCRHRFSPQPILFTIQLHLLPKLPSYVHLIPYRCCFLDAVWKEIVKKIEWNKAEIQEQIMVTRRLANPNVRVSVEAAISLTIAAGDFIKDIVDERFSMVSTCPRSVLGNIAQFETETNVLKKSKVKEPTLSKMLYTIKLPKKPKFDKKKTEDLEENKNESNNCECSKVKEDKWSASLSRDATKEMFRNALLHREIQL